MLCSGQANADDEEEVPESSEALMDAVVYVNSHYFPNQPA